MSNNNVNNSYNSKSLIIFYTKRFNNSILSPPLQFINNSKTTLKKFQRGDPLKKNFKKFQRGDPLKNFVNYF